MTRIEEAAYAGHEMPENLNPFEQLYYHGMSFIFANFKKEVIDKKLVYRYREQLIKEIDAIEQEVVQRGNGSRG